MARRLGEVTQKPQKQGENAMMLRLAVLSIAAAGAVASVNSALASEQGARGILERYAVDYLSDPNLTAPMIFGVKVGEDFYTVDVAPPEGRSKPRQNVRVGVPEKPTFYFTIESEAVLERLDRGEIAALTLMGKAFESDYAPMDVEVMDGYEPAADFGDMLLPFIFHFWTRGTPEVIRFSSEATRFVHGTNLGVFYYQPGLRSAWFEIKPGEHVNENPDSRTNPFPSLIIMVRGEATARIDGVDKVFREGEAIFVPPGVSHEFLNDGDAPAFGFLFMFGDGA
ncbi:MAG TPA: cupin domain-containing protein [Parvularculaceae bacterium]|nr:cupin domain-containing protein [Amphiplicatus sp.]HPE30185.1 cupin domain-containing protein [Parvularculaceae bacterium]